MDIFMRNIAWAVDEEELMAALVNILHKPPFPLNPVTNFQVTLFRAKHSARHKGSGILTLPRAEIGEKLLRTHGLEGLYLKGRTLTFSRSTEPLRSGVVQRLNATPWQDLRALQEENERKARGSEAIPLAEFSFGRFRRDATFSAEIGVSGSAKIACDLGDRRLKLTVDKLGVQNVEEEMHSLFAMFFERILTVSAFYLPSQIKSMIQSEPIASDRTLNHPCVFIESFTPPIFEQENTIAEIFSSKPDIQRLSSLQDGHEMPSGCSTLYLAFRSHADLKTFLTRCRDLHLPSARRQEVRISKGSVYSKENMALLNTFLGTLNFALAFQAEKAVREAVVEPLEIIELREKIIHLERQCGSQAADVFQYFSQTLRSSQPDLRRRHRRRNGMHRAGQLDTLNLSQRLDEARNAFFVQQDRVQPFSFTSATYFESYHLIVTPSTRILEGPLPDQSNSVLRRFGHHDCFIRVSLQDENRSKLRRDPRFEISKLIRSRFHSMLLKGFRLAGRKYEFLGYSMSGLREHSVWFVSPFKSEGVVMDAASIRDKLGDFTALAHQPARLGARWSQAFSATDPSITLRPHEICSLLDRMSVKGSVFTDGCSTISTPLAREVWSIIRIQRGRVTGPGGVPSCFQFRLGGAKGVLVEDPNLEGKLVSLRPSQIKFDARGVLTLEVQSTSLQPRPMFLNRPMIVILEHLGVNLGSLVALQDRAIREVEISRTSFQEASKFLIQHGLAASFRLPSLFANLKGELGLEIESNHSSRKLRHYLIKECLRCASTYALREIKYRAHIRVPGSFTLLGVSDEWGCLREGEIYATVVDERTGISQPIIGRVLISRSPQVHPGDMQYVTAVRRPQLKHLKNVVVFSCEGERSLPSCLAGGDLDGDDFNLILDPRLHPPSTVTPGEYKSAPIKTTPEPCTVKDVTDFVVNYIQSDLLGYISVMHLRIADLYGPACKDCITLAELASHAVDFPKTGTPIDFSGIPRPPQVEKPDFLSHEGSGDKLASGFYRSEKALGTLFRRVPIDDHTPSTMHGEIDPSEGNKIRYRLHRIDMDELGLPPLETSHSDVTEEMNHLLDAYSDRLLVIAQTHALSRHIESRLSEAELVSGTIMAKWADHRKRRESVSAMSLQTQQLTKAIRRELAREVDSAFDEQGQEWESDEEDEDEDDDDELRRRRDSRVFARAWAAWNAAEEALNDDPEAFGPLSFGLVALGVMLEIIKKLRTE